MVFWVRIGWRWLLGRDLSHVMPTPILFLYTLFVYPMVITSLKNLFDFSYVGCSLWTSMHVSLLGYGEMLTVLMMFIPVW